MGMDVDAKLMVGAKGCDIDVESVTDNETLYNFAEENGMEVCSPYYDCCDHEEQFVGFEIWSFSDEEDLIKQIKEAKDKFFEHAHAFGEFQAVANVY